MSDTPAPVSAEPLVVVVIPAYNVRRWLREAVDSVLGQTYHRLRLVVVDDGSTDGSVEVLEDVEDERLLVQRTRNAGVSAARNRGMAAVDGDLYAFLDGDDVWSPTKLERTVPLMDSFVAVGSRMQYIGEDGGPMRVSAGESPDGEDAQQRIARAELMPFPISSILFRADAVRATSGFDESLSQSEDLDLLARVAEQGVVGWVDAALGAYRMRVGSASAAAQAEQKLVWQFVVARRAARAAGSDLTLERFREQYRLSRRTRWTARSAALYREGGLRVANRRWSGVLLLATAVLRSPMYSVPRLLRQLG